MTTEGNTGAWRCSTGLDTWHPPGSQGFQSSQRWERSSSCQQAQLPSHLTTALLSHSPRTQYLPSLSPSSTGLLGFCPICHASLPKLPLLVSYTVCDGSPLSFIFRVNPLHSAPTSSSQWWFLHATLLSPVSAPWELEGHPAALGTAASLSNASHSPESSHLDSSKPTVTASLSYNLFQSSPIVFPSHSTHWEDRSWREYCSTSKNTILLFVLR